MTNISFDPIQRKEQKNAAQAKISCKRRAVLIVNTRSRKGERDYARAKRLLERAGVELEASYPVRSAERMPEIVQAEIEKERSIIIVGGGDGTISSVVDYFAYRESVFGLLPLGTANSFARSLGIPLDLEGAVEVIARGKVADVDLGSINGDLFANGAAIGLPTMIARATPHSMKRWLGRLAYPLVALNKLAGHPGFECTVTANGSVRSIQTLDVAIAVGGYQGGAVIAPDANVDDGLVLVQVLKSTSKRRFLERWAQNRIWATDPARPPRNNLGAYADHHLRSASGRLDRR
ncbi:YegS/Rv2252/BmrU family lipid kinase [Hoeflea alexandrii]|uniref:diacylglycerol/lipid kinase family protein n=1 Tax=Hoeflea alexandrii TaxID=288436 RepID=UPI00226E1016|nr:YegS/Rv2252/BmrU family lipid kinase [Hoeflea alexandrii]MCY0150938.1 YegS/Rv2252/BmrU family lipid kinase [Hoeflea alexandrii]